MASSEPSMPPVLVAPSTPLWFHALKWLFLGLALAFLGVFALVFRDHRRAVPLADAFRQVAVPILQHRLEQREWAAPFGFDQPPEAIRRYAFAEVWEKASGPVEVAGTWSFAVEGEGEARRGVIVFSPAAPDDAATALRSVDQRLDDGRPDTGRFRRRADGAWGLSLSAE